MIQQGTKDPLKKSEEDKKVGAITSITEVTLEIVVQERKDTPYLYAHTQHVKIIS